MSSEYNITRTRLGNYDVTWNSIFLGSTDKVDPALKLMLEPIKVGSMGKAILGHRIVGLEGDLKIELREIDLTLMTAIQPFGANTTGVNIPWGTNNGSLLLSPAAINVDTYTLSHLLKLHPTDVANGIEDINLAFAFPTWTPMNRNGEKFDLVLANFIFYPDRAQLPNKYYGYIGP